MHQPRTLHLQAMKRVLRYLKGTVNHDLFYTPSPLQLHTYCDLNWAGNLDDRRSTSSYGIFLGRNLVSWSSKKQNVVSRSSTEAEYRSMALVTAKVYWLRMLFKELAIGLPHTPTIWCDNIGAIALASNPVFHVRTKHVEIDYHFIREKVCNNDVQVQHVSTVDQIADVFTKGQTQRFQYLTNKLMVCQNPINLREVLDYQNIQQEIQEHLHQFLIISILLSIQNSHALLNDSCISVYFLMMLILVSLLYALQFHCTTINIIETAWLKCVSHYKDILCIFPSVFILHYLFGKHHCNPTVHVSKNPALFLLRFSFKIHRQNFFSFFSFFYLGSTIFFCR